VQDEEGMEAIMSISHFTREQILSVLRELDAGQTVKEVSRKHGISLNTVYRWRVKFAKKRKPAADRLHSLVIENKRLRNQFAELSLDYNTLRAALIKEAKTEC